MFILITFLILVVTAITLLILRITVPARRSGGAPLVLAEIEVWGAGPESGKAPGL